MRSEDEDIEDDLNILAQVVGQPGQIVSSLLEGADLRRACQVSQSIDQSVNRPVSQSTTQSSSQSTSQSSSQSSSTDHRSADCHMHCPATCTIPPHALSCHMRCSLTIALHERLSRRAHVRRVACELG